MVTFFSTAKPFRGHDGIIQRNALKSWTMLHPGVEVILFGDEEGAAETAKELRLCHEPHVERNKFGTKRLDFMFCRAQGIARHDLLCYINCDILLMQDFFEAVKRVRERHSQFKNGWTGTATIFVRRICAPTSSHGRGRRSTTVFCSRHPGAGSTSGTW